MIDLQGILNSLDVGNLVNLQTVLVGMVTAGLVQAAKYLKSVPISEKQTGRLRVLATILAGGGMVLTRYVEGTIDQQFLELVGQTIVGYFFSYLTYKSLLKKGDTPTDIDGE